MKIFCWGLFGLLCVVIIGQMMRDKTPEEKMMNADRKGIKDCEYVLGGLEQGSQERFSISSHCLSLRMDFAKKYGVKP